MTGRALSVWIWPLFIIIPLKYKYKLVVTIGIPAWLVATRTSTALPHPAITKTEGSQTAPGPALAPKIDIEADRTETIVTHHLFRQKQGWQEEAEGGKGTRAYIRAG